MADITYPNKGHRKGHQLSWLEILFFNHMWIFGFFLIPISLVYDLYWKLYILLNSWKDSSKRAEDHDKRVADIQDQVRTWRALGGKTPMCTARPGWKSISLQKLTYKDRLYKVNVDLPFILFINEQEKFVRVEPNVSIGQLNDFLVQKGWTVPVVPELDDLTVGGLVMGGGIESTSHKYGLFQYICRAYEMVLCDATKVWCSPTNNPEFFSAIPFSYGTLGFLTAVDIDIVPYKPYIKLTYTPVNSLDQVVDTFTRVTNDPQVDSVEGIMYSLNEGVIMSGNFVDHCEDWSKYNPIGRWYKRAFYHHVETFLHSPGPGRQVVEYIPTVDFFHRHNKSYFWLINHVFFFADNVLFRFLFGWAMPPKFSLLKFLRENMLPKEQNLTFVCQDYGFLLPTIKDALERIDIETAVYPIWLCPTRHVIHKGTEQFSIFSKEDIHVDIGVYGHSPIPNYQPVETQRRLERYAFEKGALVALYAETQFTREEYNAMYDYQLKIYEKLRKQLKCEHAFPHIWEKVSRLGRQSMHP